LAHIAAALKLAVVEVSCHPSDGSSTHNYSPERYGPWQTRSTVLRPATATEPCREFCQVDAAHCIRSVRLETVQEALRESLTRLLPAEPRR
jgi:hypothetical protein